jgi:SpoVK/Ycf46/Vps4 family AAA+-type ATPase
MFFDEIEALFRRRGTRISSDMESTVVPQFLSEIDGVEGLNNVIIIGATNRQDLLDPAILRPGRLDVKIKIERPDREAAKSIVGKYLTQDLPVDSSELQADQSNADAIARLIEAAIALIFHEQSSLRVSGATLPGQESSEKLTPHNRACAGKMCKKRSWTSLNRIRINWSLPNSRCKRTICSFR